MNDSKKELKLQNNYIKFLRFLNITTFKIWPSYYFIILFKVFTENLQVFGYSYGFAKIIELLFKSQAINYFAIYFWLVVMILAWVLDNLASNFLEIKRPVFYRKAQKYLIDKASNTLQDVPYVYFETKKFQVDLKTFETLVIPKFLTATDYLPNFLKSGVVFILSFFIFVFRYKVALLIILGVLIEIFMLRPAVFKYNQKRDEISYLVRYVQYFGDQILGLVNFRLNKTYNLFHYLNKKARYYYRKLENLLYNLQKELGKTRILAGNLGNFVGRFIPWTYYTILAINKKIPMDQYIFIFGLVSRVHNKTFVFMRVGLELYSVSNYYDILDTFVNNKYELKDSNLNQYIYLEGNDNLRIRQSSKKLNKNDGFQTISLISMKNVYFKYLNMKNWVLQNINIKIEAKRPIVITGPNGIGKTTLLYLLYGLFKPLKGQIFINEQKLTSLNIRSYQKRVGYVLQQMPNLYLPFKDSIALLDLANENKNFNRQVNIQKIKKSLKLACAEDILKKVDSNLDLVLGKFFAEGLELSGGQWRKLAIARLFYYAPDVFLLDEPFVNIDAKSRIKILDNLLDLAINKNKILVIVSHLPEVVSGIKGVGGDVISW